MTTPDIPSLVAHLVDHFHEKHRRELVQLTALARSLGDLGAGLCAHLADLARMLELHMFKEEMRLFPMLEQGGGTLVGPMVDDLVRDHRAHEVAVARLVVLAAQLPVLPPGEAARTVTALQDGVATLVADLGEHVRLEDEVLFAQVAAARSR